MDEIVTIALLVTVFVMGVSVGYITTTYMFAEQIKNLLDSMEMKGKDE